MLRDFYISMAKVHSLLSKTKLFLEITIKSRKLIPPRCVTLYIRGSEAFKNRFCIFFGIFLIKILKTLFFCVKFHSSCWPLFGICFVKRALSHEESTFNHLIPHCSPNPSIVHQNQV